MIVRCYWNLHKACWSLQDAKTRRVIGHAEQVLMRDCLWRVSEAGRQRVLREGKKNVHAFVLGTLEAVDWLDDLVRYQQPGYWYSWGLAPRANGAYAAYAKRRMRVTYDPRKASYFHPVGQPDIIACCGPMVYLGREGPEGKRKSVVHVCDPCGMTAEESARATR